MEITSLIPYFDKEFENSYEFTFTVFTPAYNAEKTISRVYESLKNQTYTNFEWLIINDGSTDNTDLKIKEIISNSNLEIKYINNETNQHKMACFIQAINLARGEFLLTFDADDSCVNDALETLLNEYQSIPDSLKPKISAVTTLCMSQFGHIIGNKFPVDPYYSNTFESYNLDGIKGEKWGFTKTNVLKGVMLNSYLFGKGLIPESCIWNLLSHEGYITKYVNKVTRIYYINEENSLSSFGIEKSALGTLLNSISSVNWFYKNYLFKTPLFFLKKTYTILKATIYADYSLKDIIKSVNSLPIKLIIIALWPIKKYL